MVDRLISNVNVSMTRSGYATHIDKRHQGISADLMTRKWVIYLDKLNCTLQFITQETFILELKPLK